MADLATLGLGVESSQVRAATRDLQGFSRTAPQAQRAAAGITAANSNLAGSFRNTASAIAVIDGPLGGLASRFGSTGALLGRTGGAVGALAVGFTALSFVVKRSVADFAELERQQLTVEAVIRATGGASGRTSQQIEEMVDAISKTTLATDDSVRQAATQLLTFRSIATESFDRTLRAAEDLSAVGFGSIESSAVQLAKALEDPQQGLTMLRRVGVSFSEAQREMIRNFQETGQVAQAQNLILKTVEAQVGGAGAAAGSGLAGAYNALGVTVNNTTERIGQQIVTLTRWESIVRGITSLLDQVNQSTGRDARMQELRATIPILSDLFGARTRAVAELRQLENDALTEQLENRAAVVRADMEVKRAAEERFQSEVNGINESLAAQRRSEVQNAILEAQKRAGVIATSAEGKEIARLVTQMYAERDAKVAAAKSTEQLSTERQNARSDVLDLIASLEEEIEVMRTADPVAKEMISLRHTLSAATVDEEAKVRALIQTRMAEQQAAEAAADRQRFMADLFSGVTTDLIHDARNRTLSLESLSDQLDKITDQLIDMAVRQLFANAFGGAGAGGSTGGGFLNLFRGFFLSGAARSGIGGRSGLFAQGGITHSPAIFGEGPTPEAAVPLPNGKQIPVEIRVPKAMQQQSSSDERPVVVHFHVQAFDAASFSNGKTQTQISADLSRAVARARRNL